MTLEEEIQRLSNGKYNFNNLVFEIKCAVSTLEKLKVGFEVKELNEDRKKDMIETLKFLIWYFDEWWGDWENSLGEHEEY